MIDIEIVCIKSIGILEWMQYEWKGTEFPNISARNWFSLHIVSSWWIITPNSVGALRVKRLYMSKEGLNIDRLSWLIVRSPFDVRVHRSSINMVFPSSFVWFELRKRETDSKTNNTSIYWKGPERRTNGKSEDRNTY